MRLLVLLIVFADAMAQTPTDFAGWIRLGLRENLSGNYTQAALAFEQAVALQPSSGRAHFLLGEAYGMQHRRNFDDPDDLRIEELAVQHLRRALEIDRHNAKAMAWLGTFASNRLQWDDSQKLYQAAAEADPNSFMAWLGLGYVLEARSRGANREARKEAHLQYQDGPIRDPILRAQLRSDVRTNLDASITALERALRIEPSSHQAMSYLQSAFICRADTQETVEQGDLDIAAAQQWHERSQALTRKEEEDRRADIAITTDPLINYIWVRPELVNRRKIHDVRPTYPENVREAGIEGTVRMLVSIDQEGRPTVIKYISGPVVLFHAAAAAVNQWKYKPTLMKHKPVLSKTEVSVTFRLP